MDNIDKLLEAVEHPERFSESELHSLLADPVTKQLYRLLCASRSDAFIHTPATDDSVVDSQWEKFKASRKSRSIFSWLRHRKIAVVIAMLIASCSIIMVGVSISNREMHGSAEQEAGNLSGERPIEEKKQAAIPLNDTIIMFEDEKLDRVLAEIAPYYDVKVDLRLPQSKEIRLFYKWDSTTTLQELLDHLNSFERINLYLKEDEITDY